VIVTPAKSIPALSANAASRYESGGRHFAVSKKPARGQTTRARSAAEAKKAASALSPELPGRDGSADGRERHVRLGMARTAASVSLSQSGPVHCRLDWSLREMWASARSSPSVHGRHRWGD